MRIGDLARSLWRYDADSPRLDRFSWISQALAKAGTGDSVLTGSGTEPRWTGVEFRFPVGGHLYGRFDGCPQFSGGRKEMPAARRYSAAVSRRTPVATLNPAQRPAQPAQRITCCFFSSVKTLLTDDLKPSPYEGPLHLAAFKSCLRPRFGRTLTTVLSPSVSNVLTEERSSKL